MKRFIITTICICIAIACMTINLLTGNTNGILVCGFSLIALCINGVQLTLLTERIAETERKIKEVQSEMEATCND